MMKEGPYCASVEVFSFGSGEIKRKIRDAVCGRLVDLDKAVAREARDGSRCCFCSRRCLILYYLNPASYSRPRN
ncbi:MAG: hypothetical protein COV48_04395 [Elusimicrobia bacterium CG11_big_fil_rev_8_21_14_0_20_64_6]|nr:MAG: hypothetical protein COV48_04395 [Elusimicrobia bacterium CG11_big_fil_rev_8_21_14_0_20_64_6]